VWEIFECIGRLELNHNAFPRTLSQAHVPFDGTGGMAAVSEPADVPAIADWQKSPQYAGRRDHP
jgi:hypothetical protein